MDDMSEERYVEVGTLEVGDRVEAKCYDNVVRSGTVAARECHNGLWRAHIVFPDHVRADGWFSGHAVLRVTQSAAERRAQR